MIIHQMDVKTAYLNAPIDCELYMEQPEGFEKRGKKGEKLVCKLNKSYHINQTVALSTCEAEYSALANAVQEAKFLRQLCKDMKVSAGEDSVLIQVDNQGAINLARNPVHHQRSKHIDIKYHFIRSEIQAGIVSLEYVPTEENIADIFTKPTSKGKLEKFKLFMLGS